jgi:hypothetical protein
MPRLRRAHAGQVASLHLHPNLPEILAIMRRLHDLTEHELVGLARGWRDTTYLSLVRDHALGPDSPLVIEVLSAFDQVDAVFEDELWVADAIDAANGGDGSDTAVKRHVVNTAVKAIRDALAAAYARPILARGEYAALMGPWRSAVTAIH